MLRAVGALLVGGVVGSCGFDPFGCADAEDCVANGADGVCEATGFCSFPDEDCDSGRRYGELAGDDLAGECVEDTAASGTGSGTSGGISTEGETATTDPSLTMGASSTMSGTTMPGTSLTASAGDDSSTSAAEADTGQPPVYPEYGSCDSELDCVFPGALCRFNGSVASVCTPPCTNNGVPAPECPAADPFVVGCLDTGTGPNACFIWCEGGTLPCPDGMDCVGNSCAWTL